MYRVTVSFVSWLFTKSEPRQVCEDDFLRAGPVYSTLMEGCSGAGRGGSSTYQQSSLYQASPKSSVLINKSMTKKTIISPLTTPQIRSIQQFQSPYQISILPLSILALPTKPSKPSIPSPHNAPSNTSTDPIIPNHHNHHSNTTLHFDTRSPPARYSSLAA